MERTRTKARKLGRCGALLSLLLVVPLAPNVAVADWLAIDPGTQVSVQINKKGTIVVRPVNGTWSHAVCADVTAAVLVENFHGPFLDNEVVERMYQLLVRAAESGSVVNVFANADMCHAQGYPLIQAVRLTP